MKDWFKKFIIVFIGFIFLMAGLFYAKKAYAFEEELMFYTYEKAFQDMEIHQFQALSYDDCQTYEEKYKFHKENAERCFSDAKNKCWYIPNIADRDKARYCLTNLGAWASATDLRSKIITVIVTTLVQYGLDCCDEWNYIKDKLHWSKYHYEMMEFYEGVINQPKQKINDVQTIRIVNKNVSIPICNIKK